MTNSSETESARLVGKPFPDKLYKMGKFLMI